MRSTLRALLFLSSTILLAPSLLRADQPAIGKADKLVRAALEAEVRNAGAQRQQLLTEALNVDPNHAPAHWHSGHVRLGNQWVKLADVPQHTSDNRRLSAYRKHRDALVDTAENHRELARWCAKNNLREESQVHWAHVLDFHPQDAEALRGLDLQQRKGQFVTREQLEQEKRAAAERKVAMQQWHARLEVWRAAFAGNQPEAVKRVLTELSEIKDPAAVPVLIAALSLDRNGQHAVDLRDTVFEALGSIRAPAITQYFLQIAVDSTPSETRDAAIEQLKKRPPYTYVPQLLAALPPELTAKAEIHLLPSGAVVHEHQIRVESRDAEHTYSFENIVQPTDAAAASKTTPRALDRELQKAGNLEAQVRDAQQQAEQRRSRIHEVLTRTTELASDSHTGNWEKQYEDYYGLYTPATEKQYYTQHARAYESYFSIPSTTTNVTSRQRLSCFAAGTQIATASGARAVESLEMGDRVLAQDVVSGELSLKPLIATTVRPAIEMIEIRSGSSSPILATPGHPFWVVGQGWQIARLLKPGDRLHSVDGAVTVDQVQVKAPAEAYNLVVSDFHTYFVGEDQLLVHDNAPLTEQPQQVPGL